MKNLIIIHARTAAGKTTLEKSLGLKGGNESVITSTTRNKREGEVHAVDYYFESISSFNDNSDIISSIQIGDNANWKYGVSRKEFDRISGTGVISIISAQYVKDTKEFAESIGVNVQVIYLEASVECRTERLLSRGEKQDSINARLDFEDKYTKEELKEILGSIIVVNAEQDPETVLKESLDKLGV